MNQRFWNGVTVSLLATIVSMATSGYAQQAQAADQGSKQTLSTTQVRQAPKVAPLPSNQQPVQSTEVVKVGELKSRVVRGEQAEVIAKIHSHESAGRQAATLYVHNIPVLTFLGSHPVTARGTKMGEADENQKVASRDRSSQDAAPSEQLSRASEARNAGNNPVWRATAVAAKINQLSRNNVDAKAIAAYWNAKCNCYSIKVKDEELVQINETTILPDTTRNFAEDALQITNRLRRLMGNAPPVREIVGKPPRRAIANVALGTVRLRISGMASWYGPGFHGNRSASGEIYNQNAMTAAHRSLPFGTKVQVTNLNNGRTVIVRINDRGPYVGGRVIDLSAAAARMLGVMRSGVAPVRLDILEPSRTVANEN